MSNKTLTEIYRDLLNHRRNLRKDGLDGYKKDVDHILKDFKETIKYISKLVENWSVKSNGY